MSKHIYNWGDTVRISINAPDEYHPGKLAEVCSVWVVEDERNAKALGEAIGTVIYSVEFGSGEIIEMPEYFLEKAVTAP